MSLGDLLRAKREELIGRFEELVLADYPRGAAGFLGAERDPFRNPVGATLRQAAVELVDALLSEREDGGGLVSLHALVRVRAVQELGPAEAVGFVLKLRRAIRDLLGAALDERPARELVALDERLDRLALAAWESYAACRQKLLELRAREATASTFTLLKRAGLVVESAGAPRAERRS